MGRHNRAVVLVACAWVSSMACTAERAGVSGRTVDVQAQDMAAIQKVHEQEIAATLSGDPAVLAELWTDDIVLLGPGQEAQVGRQAILASRKRQSAAQSGFKVLSYVPEIKNTTVTADGWAFQWGVFTGSYVPATGSEEKRIRSNLLRVLKKQADGSWKYAIGMTSPVE